MHQFISAVNGLLILSLLGATSATAQAVRSESDADISEIGHRRISRGPNLYSSEREQELGDDLASYLRKYNKFIVDAGVTTYIDSVAKKVEQSSDKHTAIAIELIDSHKAESFTLPGGHLYITKGLLLRLENEGELASAIARGVALTALRSYVKVSSHEPELDADYFGIQYLYKAGYDTQCFLNFVELVGDHDQTFLADVDSGSPPPPPIAQRVPLLKKEISEILPKRDGAVINTREFRHFKELMACLKPEIVPSEPPMKNN